MQLKEGWGSKGNDFLPSICFGLLAAVTNAVCAINYGQPVLTLRFRHGVILMRLRYERDVFRVTRVIFDSASFSLTMFGIFWTKIEQF